MKIPVCIKKKSVRSRNFALRNPINSSASPKSSFILLRIRREMR